MINSRAIESHRFYPNADCPPAGGRFSTKPFWGLVDTGRSGWPSRRSRYRTKRLAPRRSRCGAMKLIPGARTMVTAQGLPSSAIRRCSSPNDNRTCAERPPHCGGRSMRAHGELCGSQSARRKTSGEPGSRTGSRGDPATREGMPDAPAAAVGYSPAAAFVPARRPNTSAVARLMPASVTGYSTL